MKNSNSKFIIVLLAVIIGTVFFSLNKKNKTTKESTASKDKKSVTTGPGQKIPKEKLIELYKEVLKLKKKTEIQYEYQIWKNTDLRLRREVVLNNYSANSFKVHYTEKRKEFIKNHSQQKILGARRLLEACNSKADFKEEIEEYISLISKDNT